MIDRNVSSLLLKSNRILGAKLVGANLVTMKDLENANELFVERVRTGQLKEASLLKILLFETQKLSETALISTILDKGGVGGVLLEQYDVRGDLGATFGLDNCYATWTVPFDQVEDTYFLATAYYLSDFVRQFWEEKTDGRIEWYITSFNEIEGLLDTMAKTAAAAQPA